MSINAILAVLKITGLTAPQKLVLLYIANYADNKTLEAWPKIKTLAELTGLSERATRNAVNGLDEAGLITKRRSRYSSCYTVNVEGSRTAGGAELRSKKRGSDRQEVPVRPAGGAGLIGRRCRSDRQEVPLHENQSMNQSKNLSMNLEKKPGVCDAKLFGIEIIKSIYPKRTPGHNWKQAAKALTARIRQGHTIDTLIDGTRRYAAHVAEQEQSNKTWDPKYVKMAAAFFGPDEHFLLDWAVETTAQRHKDGASDLIERFSNAYR